MLTITEFNNKYLSEGLEVKILSTEDEFRLFAEEPNVGLDYRAKIQQIYVEPTCDESQLTVLNNILYQRGAPVGVSSLVIVPKSVFSRMKIVKRVDDEYYVCLATEVFNHVPDFLLVRGWRVLKPHLRGKGIGYDLRRIVSKEMDFVVKEYNHQFCYWGGANTMLDMDQKKALSNFLQTLQVGKEVDFESLGINKEYIGVPNQNSLPALIGYVKDGYRCKANYFLPPACGSLFIKEV